MYEIIYFVLFSFLLRTNGEEDFSVGVRGPCNHKSEMDALWLYLIYKLSLVIHMLECVAVAIAVTLDAVLMLTDALMHGDIQEALIINMSRFFLGVRVSFVYSMCWLYLQKIFHGDRTLFAKPGDPIYQEQYVRLKSHETSDVT